ncbi:hypothetical protein [Streptomyces asiaticus]|uniref:hypothetical protein n=1 Tax=Streptomyces asiaticus TaxID=114695 RepID=UPI00381E83D4
MQYEHSVCQLPHPRTGDSRAKSTPKVDTPRPPAPAETALVRDREQQHTTHTASRRTGPRRWLRAITWLIAAGLHPKANQTTMRVAELLAADMDYDTGHVLYRLEHRTALIPRATIARHVGYLRELGALAWVEHGSRTNRRRLMGLTGYAATATVYAATIPPTYDHAMGHRIVGTGYDARIVIDQRGQTPASSTPGPVDNPPVENPSTEGRETPSLTVVKEVGQVQVVGGVTTTEQARPAEKITPRRPKKHTILGRKVTAAAAQQADRIARWVRPIVNWLQHASHDQLSWVLLDPVLDGRDKQDIVAWLSAMGRITRDGHTWRPTKPHRVIAAALLAEQRKPGPQAMTPAEWDAYRQQRAAEQQALEDQRAAAIAERTDDERREAQQAGRYDLSIIADHITDYGEDDAIDLYGAYLTARADRLRTSSHYRMGA